MAMNNKMNNKNGGLRRVLGRVEIFSLAFGTMIGWGWIMLAGAWVRSAGTVGAILIFVAAAALCLMFGLIYAELSAAFPLAGGELAFSYRGMGYAGSWITGWIISLAYISIAAWEGIALSAALNYLFPIHDAAYLWSVAGFDIYLSWSAAGMAGAVLLTVINIMGVKQVAVFQMFLILLLLIAGIIYVLGGFAFGTFENTAPAFTDLTGAGTVLLMTPAMYIGFDMIAKSAEEVNIPLKNIAGTMILSITAAGVWYVLIILGTAMAAPGGVPGDEFVQAPGVPVDGFVQTPGVPVAVLAAFIYKSDIFGKLMICGGICGIITSWNGFMFGASRILFAMGRSGMLPRLFGIVHPRYQTPAGAIAFVGLICFVSPLIGEHSLIWFVNVAAFAAMLTYLLISVSYIRIRKKEPDLRRHYRIKRGMLVGTASILASAFFLICYAPFSPISLKWPEEWTIICVWALIGGLLILIKKLRSAGTPSPEQRERLILGEYARETPIPPGSPR